MPPSVSPERTVCFIASLDLTLLIVAAAAAASAAFAAAGVGAIALLGMIIFWPGRRFALVASPFAAVSCATDRLFFFAIVQRLSPDFTV